MMPVIAQTALGRYSAAMASAVLRLVALIAFVLMPIGMIGPPAFAAAGGNHHAAPAGHCDDMPRHDQSPTPKKMDCTASCAAMPAATQPAIARPLAPKAPIAIARTARFDGIILEIATPPPRAA